MKSSYARGAALVLAAGVALAQPLRAEERRQTFHVDAGPAAISIPEFARQANLKVLASGSALDGVRTRALDGAFAPAEALARLLDGSGLAASTSANGTVLIAPAPPEQQPIDLGQVLIVGARQAERTAIARRKAAATNTDTIVATDVASFPDNNVAEAVSRLAGVSLERSEYGEGYAVSVHGVGPSETRVEIDGMAVMSAGGIDLNGGGDGRGVELRELPADLVASVDVVKGQAVDLTEGALGGTILIKTRTGFDFKRRTISLRAAASQNSINQKWTPALNLLFADTFLDKRLGLVFNLSRSQERQESHQQQINDNQSGYARLIDFDNSPGKTFQFNPATVSQTDPAATAPMNSWPKSTAFPAGERFNSLSPLEIVRRAAAATSKQDCYSAFPWYSTAELAAIGRATDRAVAQNVRAEELRTCLNQWNDYSPSSIRYIMKRLDDQRMNADLRLDFKVNDRLTVYAKANRSRREIEERVQFLSLGSVSFDGSTNGQSNYVDTNAGFPNVTRTLSAAGAAAGLYLIQGTPSNAGFNGSQFRGLTDARVTNIVPSSVKVDANHHLTELQIVNGVMNNDALWTRMESTSDTATFGGSWRAGGLRANFLWGWTEGTFWRYNLRSNVAFAYGPVTMAVTPNGLWTYTLPGNVNLDQMDLARYGLLSAQDNGQLRSTATQLTMDNPKAVEQSEQNRRLDMSYAPDARVPLLSLLKFGLNRRDFGYTSWTGAGYTVTPGVVVPRAAVRSNFIACETGASATPCPYGVTPGSMLAQSHNSTIVMTQAAYRDIVGQGLAAGTSTTFYNSAADRPVNLFQSWQPLDAARVIALTGVQYMNLDCLKSCAANDGVVYEQPRSAVWERNEAGYVSAAFALEHLPFSRRPLPFGVTLDGDMGWRYVRTRVGGTGLLTFRSVLKTASYDPRTPDDAAGISTVSVAQNTELKRTTTELMPVLNLALWAAPERFVIRFAWAKVTARPPVSRLVSGGVTCTFDERRLAGGAGTLDASGQPVSDMDCDGTMGNPGLRPRSNRNTDLSLEWYINRDSMLSLAAFRQRGLVGDAQLAILRDQHPFKESGTVDPVSGRALADLAYTYQSWVDGPVASRSGIELSGKTAFTFLPWYFRHTGIDANITRVRSQNADVAIYDPISGDAMNPVGEQKYSWNTSLWYDDGKLSMRVAMQVATPSFARLAAGNYAPANGVAAGDVGLSFNPGSVMFRDTRRWVDAKIGYKLNAHVELFAEARNLGRAAQTQSQGGYVPFAGGVPGISLHQYGGARYSVGVVLR